MMLVRRLLAVPLIIFFVILFAVILIVTQVNGIFGNPGFYNDQLRQADIYNFVYDEALPAALDEAETDESSDIPIELSNLKDDIISASRKILPPEWLQARVETAINSAFPYVMGDTDSFSYTVVLKDRVEAASGVLKDDMLQGDTFSRLYDEGISYAADKMVENLDEMPYSLTLSKEEIESTLRTVAPEDWISAEASAAIDSVTPYVTGDSEHFTVTIHLRDRVDPAAAAVIDLLGRQETYDYLVDELITPIVMENIGSAVTLPYGVTLTRDEIASAIEEVLPQSWLQARFEEVINEVAAYVKGDAEEIDIVVTLTDRKAAALDVLTGLTDRKLETKFSSLPVCSWAEFFQAAQNLPPNTIPTCRPSGVSYQDFKTTLNIDIAGSVEQTVGDDLPDQWVFTDEDLRESLGEEDADFLDSVRDKVSQGWTFTDADLMDRLDSDEEQDLADARGWVKSGYTVTEADLRDRISETDTDLDSFDNVRHRIHNSRTWLWTLWLVPFAFLIIIALLCGRSWISRLAWGLAVLFLTCLFIYIATAVTYSHVAEPRLENILLDNSQYEGVEAVIVEKGNEVIQNIARAFASGVKNMALYFMIGSGVVLLGLAIWRLVLPRVRPA